MGISSGLGNALVPVSYGFRNDIINGNFMINQRAYASGTNLASGAYGFDRWKSNFTNTALTFTSAPQGQIVTISASGVLHQVIERANIIAGSYVLSWAGTAVGRVYNSGSTAPSYQTGPFSVVLDGTANVIVEFTPASGTATLGNVQLELGSRATPFEQRLVSVELAMCQRYFQTIPASSIWVYNRYWNVGLSGGDQVLQVEWKTAMRAAPTVTTTAGSRVHSFSYVSYNTGAVNYNVEETGTTVDGWSGALYSSTNNGGNNLPVGFTSGRNNNIMWVNAEL
jgi:hypothetical protein